MWVWQCSSHQPSLVQSYWHSLFCASASYSAFSVNSKWYLYTIYHWLYMCNMWKLSPLTYYLSINHVVQSFNKVCGVTPHHFEEISNTSSCFSLSYRSLAAPLGLDIFVPLSQTGRSARTLILSPKDRLRECFRRISFPLLLLSSTCWW